MNILLVSEGRHELAMDLPESPLGELVRRISGREIRFDRKIVRDKAVRRHMRAGKSLDYEKRAVGWLKYATDHGYDALVLVIDQDGQQSREPGIASAQSNAKFPLPRAMGVAIRSFDAWMLADEAALSKTFGKTMNRQPDPESLRDPKALFLELAATASWASSQTDAYLALSKVVSVEILDKRCPRGFTPFKTHVISFREIA